MGTPYFQLKHREASGELCFCSSNYELYGDMSRRIISILREEAVDALNARYGKGKVFSARLSLRSACSLPYGSRTPARGGYAQGLGARSWHMKRQKLSARPTTRWDELMTAR